MENLPEVIDLLANITKNLDYPLAMLSNELDILWFNDKAKDFFRNKKHFPKRICEYALGMKKEEALKTIFSGTSCEYPAKNRVGKKIYLFQTGYAENFLILAAWVDEEEKVRLQHERALIDDSIVKYYSKYSLQKIFTATEHIESSTLLDNDDELLKSLYNIERETYRMYLLLTDMQIVQRDHDKFNIPATKKFEFTEYFKTLVSATNLTLSAIGVNIQFSSSIEGERYITSSSSRFSASFLRLLKSVIMSIPEAKKKVRVTLSEQDGIVSVKVSAKNTDLLKYLSDDQIKTAHAKRIEKLDNHYYAYEYRIAESILKRIGLDLDINLADDMTIATIKIPATTDPKGALRATYDVYIGNDFSKINLIFGDVV